jgi:predicted metallopeptidase
MQYKRDMMIELKVKDIVDKLEWNHIDLSRIVCMRSYGTSTRRTLARIHATSKIIQKALRIRPHYVIEVLSENFDKLSPEEKTKTIIHEIMHIPATFGGGFRQHGIHVNRRTVDKKYKQYLKVSSSTL